MGLTNLLSCVGGKTLPISYRIDITNAIIFHIKCTVYQNMQDILGTGKALYRNANAAKLKDYTFSEPKKNVKITTSSRAVIMTSTETK